MPSFIRYFGATSIRGWCWWLFRLERGGICVHAGQVPEYADISLTLHSIERAATCLERRTGRDPYVVLFSIGKAPLARLGWRRSEHISQDHRFLVSQQRILLRVAHARTQVIC